MKFFFQFLLSILFVSCSETVVNHDSTSLLMLEPLDTTYIEFTDVMDVSECIALQETDECHIRGIKKIECFNDEYYILCSYDKTGLVVFDKNGLFVRRIGSWGKGHGEYLQTCDFTIDRKNSRILILCHNSLLKYYDLQGNYIGEKNLSKSALWKIASIDGGILCSTNNRTFTEGDDAFLFYLFDKDFNLITKHTRVLPDYMKMQSLLTSCLKTYDDCYVYSDFYTHLVYLLDKSGVVIQCYKYNKDGLMPYEYFKEHKMFAENQFKYDFILDNALLDSSIITLYKKGNHIRIAVNGTDGHIVMDRAFKGVMPKFYASDKNEIISVATLEDINAMSNEHKIDVSDSTEFFYIMKYKLRDDIQR